MCTIKFVADQVVRAAATQQAATSAFLRSLHKSKVSTRYVYIHTISQNDKVVQESYVPTYILLNQILCAYVYVSPIFSH